MTYTGAIRNGFTSSTIDLIFSTPRLAEERLVYKVHDTDHGLDHSAIETVFAINQPIPTGRTGRRLFKNAPWDKVKEEVSKNLASITALPSELDLYAMQIINVVKGAINIHIPLAKPSPYAKRWWTQSLTDLCKQYILLRNRFYCARKYNKPDLEIGQLEKQAWVVKHSYFKELRRQKKQYWKDFLEDVDNIWLAAKYLPDHMLRPSFSPIS